MMNKCENEKSRKFEDELNNCNTNINVFIKLFNIWSDMDSKERGECIEKLAWKWTDWFIGLEEGYVEILYRII